MIEHLIPHTSPKSSSSYTIETKSDEDDGSNILAISWGIAGVLLLVLMVIIFYVIWKRYRKREVTKETEMKTFSSNTNPFDSSNTNPFVELSIDSDLPPSSQKSTKKKKLSRLAANFRTNRQQIDKETSLL